MEIVVLPKEQTSELDNKTQELLKRSEEGLPESAKPSQLMKDSERDAIQKDLQTNYTPEFKYGFVQDLNGFRKKDNHVIMSPVGRGKSTFSRTIINTACEAKKTVILILSEDRVKEYMALANLPYELRDKLFVISEKDQLKSLVKRDDVSLKSKVDMLGAYILTLIKKMEIQPDYIIFDNIHTSAFYDELSKLDIMHFFDTFEEISERNNCATIFFAHVATQFRDSIPYVPEHVRGNKAINVKAHHIGALYMSPIVDGLENHKRRSCFHWVKSRTQNVTGNMYALNYNPTTKIYEQDKKIEYNTFRKFWMENKRAKVDDTRAELDMAELLEQNRQILKKNKKDLLEGIMDMI